MIDPNDFERLDNQIEDLASQVEEHFPKNPNGAYEYFSNMFPEIVAGTMVALVWGFLEWRLSQKYGFLNTRPIQISDIGIFTSPHILN